MKITSTNPSKNYELLGAVESSTEQDVQAAVRSGTFLVSTPEASLK